MSKADSRNQLQAALSLHQAGRLDGAGNIYRQVLDRDPDNPQALHYLGLVEASTGNVPRAKSLMARSLEIQPGNIAFRENYATMLFQSGEYQSALKNCQLGLQSSKKNVSLLYVGAIALYQLKQFGEAVDQFDKIVALAPNHIAAINARGSVLAEMKRFEAALASFQQVLAMQPDHAEAHVNMGNICCELGRLDEALAAYERALTLKPFLSAAWLGRGSLLVRLKRYSEAATAFDRALQFSPHLSEAWLGRGNVLAGLKRYDEACGALDKALALRPDLAEAWLGRGNVLAGLKRYDDACGALDKALALKPDLAEAWLGRGDVSFRLKRYEDALAALDKALALKPDLAEGWLARGKVSAELGLYDYALTAFHQALTLNPEAPFAEGARLHAKMQLCDWSNFDAEHAHLEATIRAGIPTPPLVVLAVSRSAQVQLQCASVLNRTEYPVSGSPLWRGDRYNHQRIRLAYLSADFGDHPVSFLLAGVFEQHDRERFETIAISYRPNEPTGLATRVKGSFEQFIDVKDRSDVEVAKLIRELEIDIAVDLMGYTNNSRPAILGQRPSPVQINYLGYPGTMGVDYIDYIIADSWVIPEQQQQLYAEKIIYLPNTYQANDSERKIGDLSLSRTAAGLPDNGFVFCAFSNSYKITPDIFALWMRLLQHVPDSVIWLLADNPTVQGNLRKEAQDRGVDPTRLIFASRIPYADYLARYRLADLFLDTLPFNAGTTASDALWSGLPLVTCSGEAFASRMGASLLRAVGMPELATASMADYEALAAKLAGDPELMVSKRIKLAGNRLSKPLFDTALFTRHLEAAYTTTHERAQQALAPDHIFVPQ